MYQNCVLLLKNHPNLQTGKDSAPSVGGATQNLWRYHQNPPQNPLIVLPEEPPNLLTSMEGSIAEKLYSESLKLSKIELGPNPSSTSNDKESDSHDGDDLQHEDGPIWDSGGEELDGASELDREWQRRHDQFHTHGYREGISAGKEASAQEGFNIGFKQSVLDGHNWGVVRGVTSALALLPDGLKEKLIETEEKRNEFKGLYESVHSISTADALRLFNNDIISKKALKQSENAEASSHVPGLQEQSSGCSRLENYFKELQSLLSDSPVLKGHFLVDE